MVVSRRLNRSAQGQRAGPRRVRVPERLTIRADTASSWVLTVRATVSPLTGSPMGAVQRMSSHARAGGQARPVGRARASSGRPPRSPKGRAQGVELLAKGADAEHEPDAVHQVERSVPLG